MSLKLIIYIYIYRARMTWERKKLCESLSSYDGWLLLIGWKCWLCTGAHKRVSIIFETVLHSPYIFLFGSVFILCMCFFIAYVVFVFTFCYYNIVCRISTRETLFFNIYMSEVSEYIFVAYQLVRCICTYIYK